MLAKTKTTFPAFCNILQPTNPPSRNDMPLRRLRSGKIPPNFVPGKIAEGLF
jgi:hypothetical protein